MSTKKERRDRARRIRKHLSLFVDIQLGYEFTSEDSEKFAMRHLRAAGSELAQLANDLEDEGYGS